MEHRARGGRRRSAGVLAGASNMNAIKGRFQPGFLVAPNAGDAPLGGDAGVSILRQSASAAGNFAAVQGLRCVVRVFASQVGKPEATL